MYIIDSHQHYWLTARTDYGWLKPEVGRIYADFLPVHLKPILARFAIHKTVVVQAAPSMEETEFMLQLADDDDSIAGVVGWLDLESDLFAEHLQRFRLNKKFVAFRPMIQDLPSEWLLGEQVMRNLRILAAADFPIDLQANPRHLPAILKVLAELPLLHAVVDHLAKPDMSEGRLEPWSAEIKQIATYPNTMCKLSGMVAGSHDGQWSAAEIQPYADTVIEAFGKQRIMFGSDWPVCLLSASYDQVWELINTLTESFTPEERQAVFGSNAIRFYRLQELV